MAFCVSRRRGPSRHVHAVLLGEGADRGLHGVVVVAFQRVTSSVPFATGLPGAAIMVLLATGFGIAFSGLSNVVALRTRNTEATMMVSFTLVFPLQFLSTALIPRPLLPGWVQRFSAINPVSYLADASRGLIVSGYDWSAIARAVVAIAIFGFILNGLAVMAFRAQGK